MSEVSPTGRANQTKEAEYKRQVMEVRKMKEENMRELQNIEDRNEVNANRMRKEYDKQFATEKVELERKLSEVRSNYAELIRKENERYDMELNDLKRTHQDQVQELKTSFSKEVDRHETVQREYMENARKKAHEQKVKERA